MRKPFQTVIKTNGENTEYPAPDGRNPRSSSIRMVLVAERTAQASSFLSVKILARSIRAKIVIGHLEANSSSNNGKLTWMLFGLYMSALQGYWLHGNHGL